MRPTDALIYRRLLLDACTNQQVKDADDWGLASYLPHAEVYYVAPDMTAVAKAAGATMPRQELRLDDLPSQEGFLIWDGAAVGHAKFADADVPVRGVAWSTSHFIDRPVWEYEDGPDGAAIAGPPSVVGPAKEWADDGPPTRLESGTEVDVIALLDATAHMEAPSSFYIPIPGLGWGIGEEPALWSDGDKKTPDITDDVAPTLLATWTLMQQTLARVVQQPAQRAERRRAGRVGLPSMVTTVHLRRFSTSQEEHDEIDVAWSHRWLVSGHWRNQWLPSRACHRLQWIAPHVKGPEHLPLRVKDRVIAWVR